MQATTLVTCSQHACYEQAVGGPAVYSKIGLSYLASLKRVIFMAAYYYAVLLKRLLAGKRVLCSEVQQSGSHSIENEQVPGKPIR